MATQDSTHTTQEASLSIVNCQLSMKRLRSLDLLRGITVAGMIVVNNAGGKQSYDLLRHSAWNGLTPCDLVFPFFLFIMGISTCIALRKFQFKPSAPVIRKVLKRTVLILCIGWAIHWVEHICAGDFFPLAHLRLTGVLPRIALCYCAASLAALYMQHKYMVHLIIGLLVAYTLLLCLGNGYATDGTNLLGIIDRTLLGEAHLYHKPPIDPEGLAGTIPSIAHTLIGFCCGRLILSKEPLEKRILKLFATGFLLMAAGFLLTEALPLNKRIWSPSFVLVTCGLAAQLLATLVYFVDFKQTESRKCSRLSTFFEVFGVNPLFLYVGSELLAVVAGATGCKQVIYGGIHWLVPNPYLASACYSFFFMGVMGLMGYVLYRKKIYIKI